jgi:outer membrane protein assembly factor BamE (lipoprotein component of BamABCDE complex)
MSAAAKPFRLQFSVRTAIVMMTIAGILLAVSLSLYRTCFVTPRVVTTKALQGIKPRMTQLQVRWAIGPPVYAVSINGRDVIWVYAYEKDESTASSNLEIEFDKDGKVSSTILSSTRDAASMPVRCGSGFL